MKTVNKTEQALLNELDKLIDYASKGKGGVPRIKLNKKQYETYEKVVGKKTEHYNENSEVPVEGFIYRGVRIYK